MNLSKSAVLESASFLSKNSWETFRLSYVYFGNEKFHSSHYPLRLSKNLLKFPAGVDLHSFVAIGYHNSIFDKIISNYKPYLGELENINDIWIPKRFSSICIHPMIAVQFNKYKWQLKNHDKLTHILQNLEINNLNRNSTFYIRLLNFMKMKKSSIIN